MHMMAIIGGEVTSLKKVSEEVTILRISNKTENNNNNNESKNDVYSIFAFNKKANYIEKKLKIGDAVMVHCIIRGRDEKIFLELSSVGRLSATTLVDRSLSP